MWLQIILDKWAAWVFNVATLNQEAAMETKTKRLPIRVGDKFKSERGVIYTVDECHPFGRGYHVSCNGGTRTTIYNRYNLELMERVS
jgi:hypothetical protein